MNERRALYAIGIGLLIGLLLTTILPNPWLGLGLGVLVGVGAYYAQLGRLSGLSPRNHNTQYESLLKKARGDRALVERLISYEQKRVPTMSREEATRQALDRWRRDNS